MAVTLCPALRRAVDNAAGQPVCRREGLAPPSPVTGRLCVCVCLGGTWAPGHLGVFVSGGDLGSRPPVCVCVWGDLGSRRAWTFMFLYLHFVSLVSKVWQDIIELCQCLC